MNSKVDKLALLRYDVSSAIGTGHMSRAHCLAAELEQRGFKTVHVVTTGSVPYLLRAHAPDHITVNDNDPDHLITTLERKLPNQPDIALIDHYDLDAVHERALAKIARCVITIDDLASRNFEAQFVVNSAPGQVSNRYHSLTCANATALLGADFAILRKEFRDQRIRHARTATSRKVPRVLISMGSTDPYNATRVVLADVEQLSIPAEFTVLLRKDAPFFHQIEQRISASSKTISLADGTGDMASLVTQHDAAIGTPSVSALERACLGVPQILLEVADNQALAAAGLAQAGAAIRLGQLSHYEPGLINDSLVELLSSTDKLNDMRSSSLKLVDGLGASRIVAHITATPTDRNSVPLIARPIKAADAEILLEWQRHPLSRKYARNPARPSRSEHARFMENRLQSSAITEILTRNGQPVAIVRADPTARNKSTDVMEVSIVVDPNARAQGIGIAALAYLDALLPEIQLVAVIDRANKASLAVFSAAGYTPTGHRRVVLQNLRPATNN